MKANNYQPALSGWNSELDSQPDSMGKAASAIAHMANAINIIAHDADCVDGFSENQRLAAIRAVSQAISALAWPIVERADAIEDGRM